MLLNLLSDLLQLLFEFISLLLGAFDMQFELLLNFDVIAHFSLILYKLRFIHFWNTVFLCLTEIALALFVFCDSAEDVGLGFVLFHFHVHEDLD